MKKCPICKKNQLKSLLNLGEQPFANKYPKDIDEIKKEIKIKLNLIFCNKCNFIKIDKIVSRKLMFEEYFYLSSVNKLLKNHFINLAKKIKKNYGSNSFVFDIGSNDGVLLEPLKKIKINCIGLDPSINVAEIANKKGLTTLVGFFDKNKVKEIIRKYKKPNVIVASSIFTHVDNPSEFIKNINNLLDDDGVFILEIEYVVNFFKNIQFERFYFDRPNYYSITSIFQICKKYKLSISNIESIPTHGGSVRIFIRKNGINSNKLKKFLDYEKKFFQINNLLKFFKKFKLEVKILTKELNNFKKKEILTIGYGCPARLSTITNFGNIGKDLIKYIIEDNELKQNRFTPGMHIPIKKMSHKIKNAKIIIVFAYDYFSDIKKKIKKNKFLFYKPIPFKKLL